MAQIDNQYLTRILKNDETWGDIYITADKVSLDVRPVYEFICQEFRSSGKIPSPKTVKQFFPAFRLKKAHEGAKFYAKLLIKRSEERRLKDLAAELVDKLSVEEPDVGEIKKTLTSQIIEWVGDSEGTAPADLEYGRDPRKGIAAHKERASGISADFSLGHQVLDEDLIGGEKGDFYIIAGTPRAGKTWLLLKTLYNLWTKERLNILLFSFELSRKLIDRRLDSIVARIPYGRFRRGMLTHEEIIRFQRRLLKNARIPSFWKILTLESAGNDSGRLDFVYSKIMQYKPDIVGIDGFYLMGGIGESAWERIAYLTRGFHSITQATGVNGWGTTQLGKTSDDKNPKLRDLSFSWTFAQDTDGAFLLSRPENSFPILTVGKFRESEDSMRYALDFEPGARIEIERMAPPMENPLMD